MQVNLKSTELFETKMNAFIADALSKSENGEVGDNADAVDMAGVLEEFFLSDFITVDLVKEEKANGNNFDQESPLLIFSIR